MKKIFFINFILIAVIFSFSGCAHVNDLDTVKVKKYLDNRYGTEFSVTPLELVDTTPNGALWTVKEWSYEAKLKQNPNFKMHIIGIPGSYQYQENCDNEYFSAYYTPQIQNLLSKEINSISPDDIKSLIYISGYSLEEVLYNKLKPLEYYINNNTIFPFDVEIIVLRDIDKEKYTEKLKYQYADKLVNKLVELNLRDDFIDKIHICTSYINPIKGKEKQENLFIKKYYYYDIDPSLLEDCYNSDYVDMNNDYLEYLYRADIEKFFTEYLSNFNDDNTKIVCSLKKIYYDKFETPKYTDKKSINYYIVANKKLPFSIEVFIHREIDKTKYDSAVESKLMEKIINKIGELGHPNDLLYNMQLGYRIYSKMPDKVSRDQQNPYRSIYFEKFLYSSELLNNSYFKRLFDAQYHEFYDDMRKNLPNNIFIVDDETINSDKVLSVISPMYKRIDLSDEKKYDLMLSKYTKEQKNVFAILTYYLKVNNEGHHSFYENYDAIVWEDALEACQEVGLTDVYDILKESSNRLGGNPSKNYFVRKEPLESHFEKPAKFKEKDFEDLDTKLRKISNVQERLMKYIKENRKSFYYNYVT